MRTVKLVLAALVLLALLAGCGAAEEPETQLATTEELTTVVETTTEAPPRELAHGSENSVTWRELDLEDEANADALAWVEDWLEAWGPPPYPLEHRLSDTMVLVEEERDLPDSHDGTARDIFLLNKTTGERTLLLEGVGGFDPFVVNVISERHFLYQGDDVFVYDLKRGISIPVKAPNPYAVLSFAGVFNNEYYFIDSDIEMQFAQLHVFSVELDNLDTATNISLTENLLAGIPDLDANQTFYRRSQLSPDARYLVVEEYTGNALYIFDLQQQAFVRRIEVGVWWRTVFRDKRTMYAFNWRGRNRETNQHQFDPIILEITLP